MFIIISGISLVRSEIWLDDCRRPQRRLLSSCQRQQGWRRLILLPIFLSSTTARKSMSMTPQEQGSREWRDEASWMTISGGMPTWTGVVDVKLPKPKPEPQLKQLQLGAGSPKLVCPKTWQFKIQLKRTWTGSDAKLRKHRLQRRFHQGESASGRTSHFKMNVSLILSEPGRMLPLPLTSTMMMTTTTKMISRWVN